MILELGACAVFAGLGWFARRAKEEVRARRSKPSPVNQFGTAILPATYDPRWRSVDRGCTVDQCPRYVMVLGKVLTCPDHGVKIEKIPILNYSNERDGELRQRRYAWDVRRDYQARLAMEAIESEPLVLESVDKPPGS